MFTIFERYEITDTTIDGRIQNEKVEILLDTGASMNIINGKLADKLELKRVRLATPMILYSISGDKTIEEVECLINFDQISHTKYRF